MAVRLCLTTLFLTIYKITTMLLFSRGATKPLGSYSYIRVRKACLLQLIATLFTFLGLLKRKRYYDQTINHK